MNTLFGWRNKMGNCKHCKHYFLFAEHAHEACWIWQGEFDGFGRKIYYLESCINKNRNFRCQDYEEKPYLLEKPINKILCLLEVLLKKIGIWKYWK